jgi:hypothetical protein
MHWANRAAFLLSTLTLLDVAQSQLACENYGVALNSTTCSCPPGFGGPTCSAPTCGGDIFQGAQRPLVANATATSFGNVSSPSCGCESGWAGTGCNVCQSASACQSAFAAAGGTTPASSSTPLGLPGAIGSNNTLTCNTASQVFAAGEMSCQVIVRSFIAIIYSIWLSLYIIEPHFASCISTFVCPEYFTDA